MEEANNPLWIKAVYINLKVLTFCGYSLLKGEGISTSTRRGVARAYLAQVESACLKRITAILAFESQKHSTPTTTPKWTLSQSVFG